MFDLLRDLFAGFVRLIQKLTGLKDPAELAKSYLSPDERIILMDGPSSSAFLLFEVDDIFRWLLAIAAIWVFRDNGLLVLIAALALITMISWSAIKGIRVYYKRYVLTTARVMLMEGVISRRASWMPWGRVTDVTFRQNYYERFFNFGTIEIASANEATGLKKLSQLGNPRFYNEAIVALVNLRAGTMAKMPIWLEFQEPLPPFLKDAVRVGRITATELENFLQDLSQAGLPPGDQDWVDALNAVPSTLKHDLTRSLSAKSSFDLMVRLRRAMIDQGYPLRQHVDVE
ncbi:MAG: PH domain-containing protein [Acidimicrobiia bacterium]